MKTTPALLVAGVLALGACTSSGDVISGETSPPIDDVASTTSRSESTADSPTTAPETRPDDTPSLVLMVDDLPGWDVVRPMTVPSEPTWEALDCPDMNIAWGATGRTGVRSRGTNGDASFRNTAVEFATAKEAAEVLDAVDRVWTGCTSFDADLGTFWSEPIAMPPSDWRTAGLVIGSAAQPNWTLAYWQDGTTVVILEIEGDEMWTFLDPLLDTMSARLGGTPVPMSADPTSAGPSQTAAAGSDGTEVDLPVVVATTVPPNQPTITSPIAPTTSQAGTEDSTFPPPDALWAEHRLADRAPQPSELGPDWTFEYGSSNSAAPADPDDAIDGCDAPVPPTLDGFDVEYRDARSDHELSIRVGEGTPADSQAWVDAFRAIAACDLDESPFIGNFDLVDWTLAGVDDDVFIAGIFEPDAGTSYTQVIGAGRIDGLIVAAFMLAPGPDATDILIDRLSDVLTSMLTER